VGVGFVYSLTDGVAVDLDEVVVGQGTGVNSIGTGGVNKGRGTEVRSLGVENWGQGTVVG